MKLLSILCMLILGLTIAGVLGCDRGESELDMATRMHTVALETMTAEHEQAIGAHMTAEATLAAHYIAAALRAGMNSGEINSTLALVAGSTVIDEFWVSDSSGVVEYSNSPGVDFSFPTDPSSGVQTAPFANLLTGAQKVVVQPGMPRQLDNANYRYVGVSGVDSTRIVQVGIAQR